MKEFEKISPTAKLVAYSRTFTDIPFAKEIAIKSNAKQSSKNRRVIFEVLLSGKHDIKSLTK
jgi:hypothetical protein